MRVQKKCIKGFIASILEEDYKFANLFLKKAVELKIKDRIQSAKQDKIFNP
jgi:CobQ-like glutamine amidotransferase family enzyme